LGAALAGVAAMLRLRALLACALLSPLVACGGSTETVQPDASADAPVGSDATSPGAGDAGCPTDPAAAVGQPCATPGQYCGSCADAASFCNEIACMGGSWTNVEVPPPPPSNDPRCPATWSETLCGQPCSAAGLGCSYPATGNGLFCRTLGDGGADGGAPSWVCGV
jgi:hypothetical protein